MSASKRSRWQQAFTRRFATARFSGTGWESLYAKLDDKRVVALRGTKPFWVGVELVHPGGPRYTGVLCAEARGQVLCTDELQRRTLALQHMRNQWPGDQLRFLTNLGDLRNAVRRSHVFGAVVDTASPAALSLAKHLAKATSAADTQTALRVLTVISPPSAGRGSAQARPLASIPASFDVLLQSKTTEPWLEHRDLAVMCAVQKDGLIGVDFAQVLGVFKESRYIDGQWVARRIGLNGVKTTGVARDAGRAERAAKKALRGIAASLPLPQVSGVVIDIAGDLRLADVKAVMETIRPAFSEETQFVLGCDARGQGPLIRITCIAVIDGPDDATSDAPALLDL